MAKINYKSWKKIPPEKKGYIIYKAIDELEMSLLISLIISGFLIGVLITTFIILIIHPLSIFSPDQLEKLQCITN